MKVSLPWRRDHENLHMAVDWILHKGMEVKSWPVMTFLRCNIIVDDETFIGEDEKERS